MENDMTETESAWHVAEVSRELRAYAGPVGHGAMPATLHAWADTLDASIRALRQGGGEAVAWMLDSSDARDRIVTTDFRVFATWIAAGYTPAPLCRQPLPPAPTAKDEQI
jgi:hypothetical protein